MQIPKGIKYKNSKKLFYDSFLYKIQLNLKTGRYFNICALSNLKKIIHQRYAIDEERYTKWQMADPNIPKTLAYTDTVIDTLLSHKGFKICSSNNGIFVYTNSEDLIQKLIAIELKRVKLVEFPNPEVAHLLDRNVIFDYSPHKYKVTFRRLDQGGRNFLTWCKQMDGYFVSWGGQYYLEKYDRIDHSFYIYVEDDNFMSMLRLYIDEELIKRIDRIEYPHLRETDEANTPSV